VIETVGSSETLLPSHQTAPSHIPQDLELHSNRIISNCAVLSCKLFSGAVWVTRGRIILNPDLVVVLVYVMN